MRLWTSSIALALAALVSACGSAPPARGANGAKGAHGSDVPTVVLPGPDGAAPLADKGSAPKPLPGVQTGALVDREMRAWSKLVGELYAPCADQAVSIAQCVQEARPCAACRPAAQLLADKVHAGATGDDARALYAIRFGPNVKKVEVGSSPARGDAGAQVTIVVWSDFECPHCRRAMPLLERAMKKFEGKVRLVHKFYPLHAHLYAEGSARAGGTARAAIAAQNQGKYWEMERLLFEHQDDQAQTDLEKYAAELKLDVKRFVRDQSSVETTAVLKRDREDADAAGLSGTPFVLINGRELDLAYFHPEEDLEPWIQLELDLKASATAPLPAPHAKP